MPNCFKDPLFFYHQQPGFPKKVIMPSSIIEWNTTRALAGTSSFGFSGTNSHGTLAAPNDGEGRAVPLERALDGLVANGSLEIQNKIACSMTQICHLRFLAQKLARFRKKYFSFIPTATYFVDMSLFSFW